MVTECTYDLFLNRCSIIYKLIIEKIFLSRYYLLFNFNVTAQWKTPVFQSKLKTIIKYHLAIQ